MKKRVKQVVGAICLVLAIALTQVPASFVEAVSNTAEFERKEDKLISFTGTAEAVSVPSGIKTICEDAFADNQSIKQVTIPSGVEVIENGAFRDCDNLEKVFLSNGLVEIGSGAFSLCENLNTFRLPDTVTKIGAGVFAGDDKLDGIDTGNNPYFHCDNGVLFDSERNTLIQYFSSNEAEEYIMPDSVTEVERYAFWGCQNLEKVQLSPYLYSIPEYMFSNCRDLKTVDIPYSVRKISAKAFEDCVRLKTVAVPLSVTEIHETAFDGCPGLRLIAEEGSYAQTFYDLLKEKQMQEKEKTKTNDHTAVGLLYGQGEYDDSVSENTSIQPSDVKLNIDEESYISNSTATYNPYNPADVSGLDVNAYYANDGGDVVGKSRVVGNEAVILPTDGFASNTTNIASDEQTQAFTPDMELSDDGSHKISKKKYYEDETLTDVILENSITEIDDFAFARSGLTGIAIPEGVTRIGYGAFYHCDNLSYIDIPSTVKEIMPQAFEETAYLKNWKADPAGSDFLVVGDGILIAYKGTQGNVTLPANVKKIAGGVFKDHTEIFKVTCDEFAVEIGEDAFAGCTQLSSISGMGHMRKIADRAFAGCPLKQIHIGNDVQWIGLGAYANHLADAIVFETIQELPKLSYEQTATRYENGSYREFPFGNTNVAVINSKVASFEDSVFDEDYLGFRGLVVSLPNGKDKEPKIAKLEYCTLLPENEELNLHIPSSVSIDGVSYAITSADVNAFEPYTRLSQWTDQTISAILLPDALGQISDYEPDLVLGQNAETTSDETNADSTDTTEDTAEVATALDAESNATDNAEEIDAQQEMKTNTTTIDLGSDYYRADQIIGEVLDDTNLYSLYVGHSDEEYDLQDAVSRMYGTFVTGQLTTFDCKLVEEETNIPITTLGQNQMKITVPVTETLYKQEICAVSLDATDNLQMHYGTKHAENDTYYFTFYTNHFSPYGIYAGIGEQAEMIKKQSDALLSLDDSPDTGEKMNPFWILAIAFGCVGIVCLLNGFKRHK